MSYTDDVNIELWNHFAWLQTNRSLARKCVLPALTLFRFVLLNILILNLIRLKEKSALTLQITNVIFRRVRKAGAKSDY